MKTNIVSLYEDELENQIVSAAFPKYRSAQIVNWLKKGVRDFDRMTNLPADLRSFLKENFSIYEPGIISSYVSSGDGTRKFLWKLEDGNAVETVLMKYKYGDSVCISTQVGCRQGCAFCASTLGGLVRNLDAGEMLDEVLFTVKESGGTLHSIVRRNASQHSFDGNRGASGQFRECFTFSEAHQFGQGNEPRLETHHALDLRAYRSL